MRLPFFSSKESAQADEAKRQMNATSPYCNFFMTASPYSDLLNPFHRKDAKNAIATRVSSLSLVMAIITFQEIHTSYWLNPAKGPKLPVKLETARYDIRCICRGCAGASGGRTSCVQPARCPEVSSPRTIGHHLRLPNSRIGHGYRTASCGA